MTEDDVEVTEAMIRYGGSFVKALGRAAQFADADNLEKIKIGFSKYWEHYAALARARRGV